MKTLNCDGKQFSYERVDEVNDQHLYCVWVLQGGCWDDFENYWVPDSVDEEVIGDVMADNIERTLQEWE